MNKSLQKALARELHPTYDVRKSYEWNYRNGPLFKGPYPPPRKIRKRVRLLDFELNSPLGIAAGPLLNSDWIRVYAKLGFDLLSYKTVRTRSRSSNPKPNCVFVETRGPLTDDRLNETLQTKSRPPTRLREISITNSFGVPSRNPSVWQEDVQRAKRYLDKGQVLIVSTLGSAEYYPDTPSFIKDFAQSAAKAREAGADIVELDLSCPNSNAAEGMIYLDPNFSGAISKAAKAELGAVPLFIKLGNFWKREQFESVVKANAPHVNGIIGINTVKMTVLDENMNPAIPGRPQSGVCGAGIKPSGLQFVRWLYETRKMNRYDFVIIGVGGIMTPDDIGEFLSIGIDAVEVATAAMWDPYLAYRYYRSHS
ncbi:MAG: dihydroorotate dehydrogenase [Nitrospirae bacterium]|nr:dihydroorotate dehydrogenase [Nitrospirota bacterium]